MKPTALCLALLGFAATVAFAADEKPSPPIGRLSPPGWRHEELRRFQAPEAGQGVAVDREFFYAINNHTIGKYHKATGERVAGWEGGAGGEISHLNAGLIVGGRLYTVHSNYPSVPMLSSLEIFDPATLKHIGSHSFGRMDGSFTWLDRRGGSTGLTAGDRWIACFVHSGNRAAEPGLSEIVGGADADRGAAGPR